MYILWLLLCYLSGALPWSVWLGWLFYRVDPRRQRDHNPGATNAFRAAGWRLGVAVLVLDFLKAVISVAAARWVAGFSGPSLLWLAIMPTLGHAFSVFLRFHGGRGIVVMFGVWAGLTLYQMPLVMGLTALAAILLIRQDECRALAIPVVLIGYLLLRHEPVWMVALASAQLLVLASKIGVYAVQQRVRGAPTGTGTGTGAGREAGTP